MPSNKDRLYVALYVRGGAAKIPGREDTYVCGQFAMEFIPLMKQQLPLGLVGGAKRREVDEQGYSLPRPGAYDAARLPVGV
jgi:hypothetical protein